MTKEIKAIETEYNGYKFRSRLEARWGVFFDALGIKYEYEPEGFELPNGQWYLPDFKIRVRDYSVEYKYEAPDVFYDTELEFVSEEEIDDRLCPLYKNPNNTFIRFRCDSDDCVSFVDYVEYDLFIEVKGNMTNEDLSKIEEFSKDKNIIVLGDIPFDTISSSNDIYFNDRFITNAYKDLHKCADCTLKNIFLKRDNWSDKKGLAELTYTPNIFDYIPCEIARKVRFEHGQTPTADVVRRYEICLYRVKKLETDMVYCEQIALPDAKKLANEYEKRFYGKN